MRNRLDDLRLEDPILVGDVGGTKTWLALATLVQNKVMIVHQARYPSQKYSGLDTLIEAFFASCPQRPSYACFGIAGPVRQQSSSATNLPWFIDSKQLCRRFAWKDAWLINDLEATAWGLSVLDKQDFHTLQDAQPSTPGHQAIIAAGTGLGEAGLFFDGERLHPFASEGGHTDFSPSNADEYAVQNELQARYGHVSWERLVSGPGLVYLHDFLCRKQRIEPPDWLNTQMQTQDPAATIAQAALERTDALCQQALDWFVQLYGREAGNLALKLLPRGGLYLGGGIAPKILPALTQGTFMDAFLDKGRMRAVLAHIPVKVILEPRTALFGPLVYAAFQLAN